MHKILFLSILFTIVMQSCYKDNVVQVKTIYTEYPEIIIESTNVLGQIIYNDQTIPEITNLVFNGEEYNFYESYFNFKSNNLNRNFEVLKINMQEGFILHYPLNNFENTFNKHHLEIPKIENIVSIQDETYTLTFSSGSELTFQANIFIDNGIEVSDPIVYFEELTQHTIPGNNQGISENEEVILLKNSEVFYLGWKEQRISFNSEIINNTSSKELYYLNPVDGQWRIKEVASEFSPGFYAIAETVIATSTVVEVETDIPGNEVFINIKLEDEIISSFNLSQLKTIPCFVPFEQAFDIEVLYRNQELIREEFFKTDDEKILLDVSDIAVDIMEVFVSPRNCSNEKRSNLLMEIVQDNIKESFLINDDFIEITKREMETLICSILDVENELSTSFIPIENLETIYLGRQFLCPIVEEEFVFLLTEGNTILLTDIEVNYNAPNIDIIATSSMENVVFNLSFDANSIGSLDDEGINISLDAPTWANGYIVKCNEITEGCGFTEFDVKVFEESSSSISKFIFDGNFWMESIDDQSVGYRRMVGEIQIVLP